jgi:hypothetical protein
MVLATEQLSNDIKRLVKAPSEEMVELWGGHLGVETALRFHASITKGIF